MKIQGTKPEVLMRARIFYRITIVLALAWGALLIIGHNYWVAGVLIAMSAAGYRGYRNVTRLLKEDDERKQYKYGAPKTK